MTPEEITPLLRRVMRDTRKLYTDSGRWLVARHKTLLEDREDSFVELMDDLHRGLLMKVYAVIIRADGRWTRMEKFVGSLLIEHLWDQRFQGAALREAADHLLVQADRLSWDMLVRPFMAYRPLNDRIGDVQTVVMRMANLTAKCDGLTTPQESDVMHRLQDDITVALGGTVAPKPSETLPHEQLPGGGRDPLDNPIVPATGGAAAKQTLEQQATIQETRPTAATETTESAPPEPVRSAEQRLNEAMAELDQLIGLPTIKDRVKSLANFLRLQHQRRSAGLPTMPISLHMSFVGNPGTGKTTVARIVAQIMGAMGVLSSGHLVETDRSGLVAEYAGQTGVKTNKLIDSALDGVLFIDEAYSLVSSSEDAYGREAIQTLLKRMEDNRDRLVVIVAGYPDEMDDMIRSNPGLSSRINTRLEFPDYEPADLGRIFELLCRSNHYRLPPHSRHRLLIGFDWLHRRRDRHFGNGRLSRNAFEECVRRLADRVADIFPLTPDLLSTLEVEDIVLPGIAMEELVRLEQETHTLRVECVQCKKRLRIDGRMLGCQIRCPKCSTEFVARWCDVEPQ